MVVNPDCQKVTLCFYCPLLWVKDFFTIEYKREDIQADIDAMLEQEKMTLAEVNQIVSDLTAF